MIMNLTPQIIESLGFTYIGGCYRKLIGRRSVDLMKNDNPGGGWYAIPYAVDMRYILLKTVEQLKGMRLC